MSMDDPRPDTSGPVDTVTVTTHVSWLERLGGALAGVLIGLVLVIGTGGLLFWNEGRAVTTARSLAEGADAVVDVDAGRVDPSTEGRLVHLDGDLVTQAPLVDPELSVRARAARLVRTVQYYEWKEDRETVTHKNLGGSQDQTTTYTYTRAWSDRHIESGQFHDARNHGNPPPRFGAFEAVARDASLGAFRPGPAALSRLPADQPLPLAPSVADDLGRASGTRAAVADGMLLLPGDPGGPRIGDVRVGYRVAPQGRVSLVGRQTGTDVTPYRTVAGDDLLLAAAGSVPAAALFRSAERDNTILTWIIRVAAMALMWLGFILVLRPLAVVGDLVPALGSVLSLGAALVALASTAVLGSTVLALAWVVHRPLVALALLAAGLAVAGGLRAVGRRRRAPLPA